MSSTVAGIGSGNAHAGTLPVVREKQETSRASNVSKRASQTFTAHGSWKQTTPEQAVAFANTFAERSNTKLSFRYDERIDQVVVQIKEGSTEEVIRQIPPEEMVEIAANFKNDFRGLLLNHQG